MPLRGVLRNSASLCSVLETLQFIEGRRTVPTASTLTITSLAFMNTFCPTCANLLTLNVSARGPLTYSCECCPYLYSIDRKMSKAAKLKKKRVEDVLGGEEAWKNAPRSPTQCPKCGHGEAYYNEVQTRSADEPATLFFRCCKCHHNWKEG